ncbi:MAG: tetratricopeptide repeat protein [Crocosphaera sp.]|nr:tetratricopeptide repeat protein [Crocosphaera sp.]
MSLETSLKLSNENNRSYQGLLSVIEASENTLSILIAVCDDRRLRDKIIEAYEQELSPNIASYHTRLDQNEPSLRAAIYKIVQLEAFKNNEKNVLLTITGSEDLLFIRNNGEKSQQEKFFGYLQWTREGLREFPYPIVLWVTNQILVNLSRKAPDFWSWRKGVFHFLPEPSLTPVLPPETDEKIIFYDHLKENYSDSLSWEDLEELITNTEKKRGKNDPNLVTLYNRLGKVYFNRIRSGEAVNFPDEKEKALHCYCKALEISREIGDGYGEGRSLQGLGIIYDSLGQYQKAITYHQQALEIFKKIRDQEGEIISLIGLANACYSLGKYEKAISFYQKSLDMAKEIEDSQSEAYSLMGLGISYKVLGEYQKAIDFQQQCLEISRKIKNKLQEATSLNNLGIIHKNRQNYQEARKLYQQSLGIYMEIGDKKGEANSSYNLGIVYRHLNKYKEAINAFDNALQLYQDMGLNKMVKYCRKQLKTLCKKSSLFDINRNLLLFVLIIFFNHFPSTF